MSKEIIDECYKKSIELLLNNSSKYGLLACASQKEAKERNYLSIFARDSSMSSLGMVLSKNKKLIKVAKISLQQLAAYQANNGEIPNYIKPELSYADFWRNGSIDASLWWLLAVDFYDKYSGDKSLKKSLKINITKAINWLFCQEHNNDGLLRQGEASDWADLMPRSGKVLYTNALWCKVKKEYNLIDRDETAKNFNLLFYPFNNKNKKLLKNNYSTIGLILKEEKNRNFYFSFVNYLYWGEDIDVFGNSLAVLFNLAPINFRKEIINFIFSKKRLVDFPVPVLFNPIKKDSKLWRKYMERHEQNYPYQYHNGGTWPFASCFFAICLKKNKQEEEAKKELEKIAKLNKVNNWGFNEWFNTKTGEPCGMRGQSWNAGAFLLAYHFLFDNIDF